MYFLSTMGQSLREDALIVGQNEQHGSYGAVTISCIFDLIFFQCQYKQSMTYPIVHLPPLGPHKPHSE